MSEQTQQAAHDVGREEALAQQADAGSQTASESAGHDGFSEGGDSRESAAQDQARRAPLPNLSSEASNVEDDVNLRMILDIPVTVSMEIGRTRLPIRTLLQLNQGSVVELERLVGEPLDVLVNGTLIAHGEVVVINEKYGIRLTDVVSPDERVRKLR